MCIRDRYLAYWGYAVSIATLLTALAGPVFGTVADTKGYKKPVFTIALGIGAIASVALGFAKYWLCLLYTSHRRRGSVRKGAAE